MLHAHDTANRTFVQIPLWTIVTPPQAASMLSCISSDSSMDDCNEKERPPERGAVMVQIPLWTIVTEGIGNPAHRRRRFRFLYGRL